MTTLAPRYMPLLGIGRGGMGRVDLAMAIGLPGAEQLVVLKRLREADEPTEEARNELVREARLSARLMHPNVAATLGLDFLGDEIVLVLEYLEGATLSALVRSCAERGEGLPTPILLRVVRDALCGLAYAHELRDYDGSPLGIVHRDVSPANLLVTTEGITKVLDFGIAKAAPASSVTPPGYVKGKLGYMAPEQLLGGTIDLRADLYAIGVILWEGLTQRRFSQTSDIHACVSRRLDADAPSVRALAPAVPLTLENVVRTCLARDPRDRWPSASMLRAALDAHVASHGGDATTHDVARFVAEHCGEALRARRVFLQDRFAALAAGRPPPGRTSLGEDRTSASPVAVDIPLVVSDTVRHPPVACGERPPVERRIARVALPAVAALVGASLSLVAGEVQARFGASSSQPNARSPRSATVVAASRDSAARGKAERASVDATTHGKARASTPTTTLVATDVDTDRQAAATPASAPAPGVGFATIDSYPWSRVTIDGAPAGVTPLVHTPLRAGTHGVVLESPDRGRHELTITVVDGETVAQRWQW